MPADKPLAWGAAEITWTPSGYTLSVPMYLDDRAAALLESALPEIPVAELGYSLRAAVWHSGPTGTRVDPGELVVSSSDFFDVGPAELRMHLDNAANRAKLTAERDQAEDEARARMYLQELRDAGPA